MQHSRLMTCHVEKMCILCEDTKNTIFNPAEEIVCKSEEIHPPPPSQITTQKTIDIIQKRRGMRPESRLDTRTQHYTSTHKAVNDSGRKKECVESTCSFLFYLSKYNCQDCWTTTSYNKLIESYLKRQWSKMWKIGPCYDAFHSINYWCIQSTRT